MIEIRAEDLVRVARAANAIADDKSYIVTLGDVAVSGAAGILTLEATDLERYASLRAVGSGDSVEPVAVSAKALVKGLGLFKRADALRVERDGEGRLVLSSGRVSRRIRPSSISVEDRPETPDPTIVGGEVALPIGVMRELLDAVEYACSPDKDHLRVILVEREGGRARVVATDGRRISVASREWTAEGADSVALADGASWRVARDVLAAAGPDRIARVRWLRGDGVEYHELSGPGARILYRTESSNSVPEHFPPWRRFVPRAWGRSPIAEAGWPRRESVEACRRIKKIAESSQVPVRIYLIPGRDVRLDYEDEGGQLEQDLPESEVVSGPGRVAVDPRYLIGASVAAGEGATLRLYSRNDKSLADPEWTSRAGDVERIQVIAPMVRDWSDEEDE